MSRRTRVPSARMILLSVLVATLLASPVPVAGHGPLPPASTSPQRAADVAPTLSKDATVVGGARVEGTVDKSAWTLAGDLPAGQPPRFAPAVNRVSLSAATPIGPWSALGSDGPGAGALNNTVTALVVYNGDLYVGGFFTDAGGIAAADYLARWDGSHWFAVGPNGAGTGALSGNVWTLGVYDGSLYVGGDFADAAGIPAADYIARWDGSQWFAVGSDGAGGASLNGTPTVDGFAVLGGNLYVGGWFTNAGGDAAADYVASWNGTSWSALGSNGSGDGALNGGVSAVTVYNGGLAVGGWYRDAAGIPTADEIAWWHGGIWSALGSNGTGDGVLNDGDVGALVAVGTSLYVGGDFTNAANNPEADHIAEWNGSSWSALGSDGSGNGALNGTVVGLAAADGSIYVGGGFSNAGAQPTADLIARWDGQGWSGLGSNGSGDGALYPSGAWGTRYGVFATVIWGENLYVGGGFADAAGIAEADYVAEWSLGPSPSRPTVTGVNPVEGSYAGGSTVTLNGTNLQNASSVSFGGASAVITSRSAQQLTVTAPYRAPQATSNTVNVVVTTPDGTSATSAADHFTYRSVAVFLIRGMFTCTRVGPDPCQWTTAGDSFRQPGGIVDYLVGDGWPTGVFVDYSYKQGSPTYACGDSLESIPGASVPALDAQLRSYIANHDKVDIYLVGHSQGGVVALSYPAYLQSQGRDPANLTASGNVGHLAGVVTLDSPIGGLVEGLAPLFAQLQAVHSGCSFSTYDAWQQFMADHLPQSASDIADLSLTGFGNPWGGTRSVASAYFGALPLTRSNQSLAHSLATSGSTRFLTVGNRRDGVFSLGIDPLNAPAISTQWIADEGSGVDARIVDEGVTSTAAALLGANHSLVLSDPTVEAGIETFFDGHDPATGPGFQPSARRSFPRTAPRTVIPAPTVVVTGTVTAAGGASLAGISVVALPVGNSDGDNVQTAADGTYSLDLAPGTYKIAFIDPSGGHAAGYYTTAGYTSSPFAASPVSIAAAAVSGIDVTLPGAHAISGRVTDPNGAPVPNVAVLVESPAGELLANTTTGADGSWSAIVRSGAYVVQYLDPDGTWGHGYYSTAGTVADLGSATPINVGSTNVSEVGLTADGAPTLSVNDTSVTEGNAGTVNAAFTVSLSAASGQTVTVHYATADGTASQPSDYTSTSGNLSFAPGETSKPVSVPVRGDTLAEANETFSVNLSSPTNASIADGTGVGTITDDDAPAADTTPPTVTAPSVDFLVGVAIGTSSKPVPLTIAFSATDPSGIALTRLQHKVGRGAYANVPLSPVNATTATVSVGTSTKKFQRFRARATDGATPGNTSPFVACTPFKVEVFQDGSRKVKQGGKWSTDKNSNFYGRSTRQSSKAGHTEKLTLKATDFAIVATKGKNRGIAEVFVDGVLTATIDLYAKTTQYRQVVYAVSFATLAKHTITFQVMGTKNAKSKGKLVDFDAFLAMAA